MTDELDLVLDHVTLSVADLDATKAFYGALLAPLGVSLVGEASAEQSGTVAFAGFGIGRKGQLWIAGNGRQSPEAHICFGARSRADVRAFHSAGVAAGGKDNGAPGIRENYHPAYYAALVVDPEGQNIEAVCFEPEASE